MTTPFITLSSESNLQQPQCYKIQRRGFLSGCISVNEELAAISAANAKALWNDNRPIYLPNAVLNEREKFSEALAKSKSFFETIVHNGDVEEVLDQPEYIDRLGQRFEMLATRCDDADLQEIVSVDFDVMENGEMVMEDVWMRISWLSFENTDRSLRFRFSFGMEGYDDVSLDFERQLAAAELCEHLFPESVILSGNESLTHYVSELVGGKYVLLERIIYFNAPNGGAQFHHDAEKGHLGVVYAQLTGSTFWFAMSKQQLMDEILLFVKDEANLDEFKNAIADDLEFQEFMKDVLHKKRLPEILDNPAHDVISVLLNNVQPFFQQLVGQGYGYRLLPGDVILLPQQSMKSCAWHSVFCLGDEAGQALSFAIKKV